MYEDIVDSPQYALDRFDSTRVTWARERLGITRKELAERIRKTPSAISQIESGSLKPDLRTFIEIANALEAPTSFFILASFRQRTIELGNCHFRAKRSVSQKERRRSVRIGEQLLELMSILESQGISFPGEKVSSSIHHCQTIDDIEVAATTLRHDWGMGLGPIPNVVQLLESKGVVVLPIYDSCQDVDAFSVWSRSRPCIMLALGKSASRARFDAAHELGHLILHEEVAPGDSNAEKQADRFAGAFLAPRDAFMRECPKKWDLSAFLRLKSRWKISVQALVRRAYDLGQLSYASYSRAFQDISRRGMRQNEGEEWEIEQPTLIKQALILLKDSITLPQLAEAMSIYPSELHTLLRQCVPEDLLLSLSRTKSTNDDNIVKFTPPQSGLHTLHGS